MVDVLPEDAADPTPDAAAGPLTHLETDTARGRSRNWTALTVLLIVAAAVAAVLLSRRQHRVLTEKDTIVLADFANTTGDPVFDDTLRQGMAVQLEQSPFLSLIPDGRLQQTLSLMGQPTDTRLTLAVAREICERTASAAVLDGAITTLGSRYVLAMRAQECRTGKVLAEEQVQAARKEDVLNALDQVASRFRIRLGESLTTVEKYDTPLAEATTPSLEALKAYSLALKVHSAKAAASALSFSSTALPLIRNSRWPTQCKGTSMANWASLTCRRTASARPINCRIAPVTRRSSLSPLLTISG